MLTSTPASFAMRQMDLAELEPLGMRVELEEAAAGMRRGDDTRHVDVVRRPLADQRPIG
jgi:hypothetical protein